MTSSSSARDRAGGGSPRASPNIRTGACCCWKRGAIFPTRRRFRRCSASAANTAGASRASRSSTGISPIATARAPYAGAAYGGRAAGGAPFDFARWASMGCAGWAWGDVAPLFNAIETDLDFGDQPNHGNSGPIVIQRYKPASWAPVNRVMYEACLELGVREARDLNAADGQAGVIGPMPHNRYKEVRMGTLVTYLRAARSRANLTIQAVCLVDRVLLSGAKATGVSYLDREGSRGTAHAEEIVLSAGVYNTPAILQRSGIGPAEWLRPLGIPVAAALPVGHNLLDHPGFGMRFRGEGLGTQTGRLFAANVRGPANGAGEPEWQTHPFPIDEEENIAGV